MHKSCVDRFRHLSARCHHVWLEHVYREFNVEADGAANEGIDAYNPLFEIILISVLG